MHSPRPVGPGSSRGTARRHVQAQEHGAATRGRGDALAHAHAHGPARAGTGCRTPARGPRGHRPCGRGARASLPARLPQAPAAPSLAFSRAIPSSSRFPAGPRLGTSRWLTWQQAASEAAGPGPAPHVRRVLGPLLGSLPLTSPLTHDPS